ncbi:hypothetical protein B0H11DRAFT_660362 [Mycena galericulata]|nr:hypothetical protein B0H11DRAFT_660362 [Mycena galericulata]
MPFCGADTSSTAAVSFFGFLFLAVLLGLPKFVQSCCTEPLRERETTLDSQRVQREIMSSEHDLALGCDGLSFPPPPPYMPRPPLDLQSEMRDGYAAWGAPRSLAV